MMNLDAALNIKPKKKLTFGKILLKVFVYLLLILISIIVLIPILWIVGSSLNPGDSLYTSTMFPKNPTFIHYKELFTKTDFPIWYKNTLKIATANMILSVILTTSSSYVISRFKFKGKKASLITILVLQMFPSFLAMTALYVLLWQVNLLNTHWGLILVYAGGQLPYNTWLIKGYFDSIPKSLDEAARVDGASNFTTFTKIILPLARPIIVFIALTNFIGPWMDFIFPNLVLRTADKKTLAMGLYAMVTGQSNTKFTTFAAGAILVAIPITLLFVYLQKHIITGLSSGAVKG
ncbi:sugar ABC transporter permease [Caloramator australicus]|uniref:Maltose/maltodextrin ABC transporter, permease protein MalG n=1 Tax=Caloramator australicus RC3 TaxID=857293 RepID=I7LFP3_9CLOT|nr:sugar ABC transporter permease [Caloramator australicus]CCJ32660.1 Maltose/maltodextrin ABC transporter, permease protein MalG [Caloramator australicus RC3]